MIRSIRRRLQWWYGSVYALSIIVFGCFVYWRADRDVHERATQQAVSAALYLDVSLRNVRPIHGPGVEDLPAEHGRQPFPPEFTLGLLPPEFQLQPPGDHSPGAGPGPGPGFRPQGPPPDLRTDDRSAPPTAPDVSRTRDASPDGRRPQNIRPRPPLDRMEFVIWRNDGSVQFRSRGLQEERGMRPKPPAIVGHQPRVMPGPGYIDAVMHGPGETTILVRRPLEHDMAGLHHFGLRIAAMAAGTLVIGITGGSWISSRMVQPIQLISETAAQVSAASLDRRIDTSQLDQELVQLASVLNNTFERLELSFGRLTQFTADASHELRTPLAVIQSQIELALSRPRSTESYQETLETCLRSSERLRSLVDGLLFLARTDADRSTRRFETIDLGKVTADAVAQLQEKATTSKIRLEYAATESVVRVTADKQFLIQVPVNLIDNAIQHTSPGGQVKVEVRVEGDQAVLSVRDNGCGIAAQHLPHVFERFYRADIARSRARGGCGLGLSICRSLVESFGGRIACNSVIDAGTEFVVSLPIVANSTNDESEADHVS